jgi:predicted O-methyltransferase YrrM
MRLGLDYLLVRERIDGGVVWRRFEDYEGRRPSLYSCFRFPLILRTWYQRQKGPIINPPLPMLVLDAIRFLDQQVTAGTRVLELGGGNSTLWFLGKGAHLTTLESSTEWAEFIKGKVAHDNLMVLGQDAVAAYLQNLPDGSFDLVLVDCKAAVMNRNDAVRIGRSKVRKGGWLVLDNSDAPRFRAATNIMNDRPRKTFTGFTPMRFVVCQTSAWQM